MVLEIQFRIVGEYKVLACTYKNHETNELFQVLYQRRRKSGGGVGLSYYLQQFV